MFKYPFAGDKVGSAVDHKLWCEEHYQSHDGLPNWRIAPLCGKAIYPIGESIEQFSSISSWECHLQIYYLNSKTRDMHIRSKRITTIPHNKMSLENFFILNQTNRGARHHLGLCWFLYIPTLDLFFYQKWDYWRFFNMCATHLLQLSLSKNFTRSPHDNQNNLSLQYHCPNSKIKRSTIHLLRNKCASLQWMM